MRRDATSVAGLGHELPRSLTEAMPSRSNAATAACVIRSQIFGPVKVKLVANVRLVMGAGHPETIY